MLREARYRTGFIACVFMGTTSDCFEITWLYSQLHMRPSEPLVARQTHLIHFTCSAMHQEQGVIRMFDLDIVLLKGHSMSMIYFIL